MALSYGPDAVGVSESPLELNPDELDLVLDGPHLLRQVDT